jgi:glycosyltransferase involved in cell wall biosynthesis
LGKNRDCKMKIVVNTRLLITDKLSGIGWFAYHTLKRIVINNPQHQFVFLFDRPYEARFIFGSNVIPEIIFPPTRHPFLSYIWFEYSIVHTVRKHKPDLFFSPDGYLSLKLKDIPAIPVIHDINFYHYPQDLPWIINKYYQYFFPKFAQQAKRILTVSEYSKNDISTSFNISPGKIDVAYNAANEIFEPIPEKEKISIKEELTNGCEYFVYVGVLVPRKNITRMLQAFDEFKKTSGSKAKLVIVGAKMFLTDEMEKAYQRATYKLDIIFTGRLSTEKLKLVLGAALALVYVSYFEGFGIPIVEAMHANVPVITSNVTAMPEIAGAAALLVDPFSIDSIKNAMLIIEKDKALREKLINKAIIRRQDFNWDKTADLIWESFEKAIT